ncbi:MAG: UDP-3-O-(3-hydroxymyristoyl)glucosamine N-acyltransferase [Candidatus Margulisbacteria bacterium]|nr:UDP-3-O-(3-hydroxymyristoyl)glucosamine N-acyltransferase [Candidatus Margulisiibacteriota bacterium]
MSKTTAEIAKATGGKLIGSAEISIEKIAEVDRASAQDVAIAFEKDHLKNINSSKAGAFILTEEIKDLSRPQIIVKNGRLALAQTLELLNPLLTSIKEDIHPTAVIHPTVNKGKNVTVGPYAVIEKNVAIGDNVYIGAHSFIGEDSAIGDNSVIYPNVSIYAKTLIGKRVRINSGSAVGVDGFGFVQHEGKNVKIPQVGRVVLEDDVELCGLNTIARATIDETRIGAGTKIDSMVHIGHNAKIGKNCVFVASSACAGNAVLGDNVIVAGMSGISDHVKVGDNTVIMANSVVTKDCPPNTTLLGFPAKEYRSAKKNQALVNKLEDWVEKIKKLEKKVFGSKK